MGDVRTEYDRAERLSVRNRIRVRTSLGIVGDDDDGGVVTGGDAGGDVEK